MTTNTLVKLVLYMNKGGMVKGQERYIGSITEETMSPLDSSGSGSKSTQLSIQRIGKKSNQVKLQIPLTAIEESDESDSQMELVPLELKKYAGVQQKAGFELLLQGKKKKYQFEAANVQERDLWIKVLAKYAKIKSDKMLDQGGCKGTQHQRSYSSNFEDKSTSLGNSDEDKVVPFEQQRISYGSEGLHSYILPNIIASSMKNEGKLSKLSQSQNQNKKDVLIDRTLKDLVPVRRRIKDILDEILNQKNAEADQAPFLQERLQILQKEFKHLDSELGQITPTMEEQKMLVNDFYTCRENQGGNIQNMTDKNGNNQNLDDVKQKDRNIGEDAANNESCNKEEQSLDQFESMITVDDNLNLDQLCLRIQNDGVTAEHTFEEKVVPYWEYGFKKQILTDSQNVRVQIPGNTAVKIKMSLVLKMLKDLVGKDLSRFSMPVFINEPTTVMQKPAEFCFFSHLFTKASMEKDPVMRMMYVSLSFMSGFNVVPERKGKPFNPLLGETYELVSPEFRYFSEMVSHHPPICCYNLQGLNFESSRQMETVQSFTGKQVQVYDKNLCDISLTLPDGTKELYQYKEPTMVVGNLFVGTTYVEPQGLSTLTCKSTGYSCLMDFKTRSVWSTRASDLNFVTGTIKDKTGQPCYKVEGQYTKSLYGTDLRTPGAQPSLLSEAMNKPAHSDKMFGMNIYSLQLNYLPKPLLSKLPPTDCRLRGDLRAWDQANLELATSEKHRLENNQRTRRNQVREMLKGDPEAPKHWDISDERTFYNPQYFEKKIEYDEEGQLTTYKYYPKKSSDGGSKYLYWEERERAEWAKAPRIFEDGCQPFY